MEKGSIIQFFENKCILVTGATGYLAKIFVEKISRVQPNINKIYLLLRASSANSATERLQREILGKELFRVLRERHGENFNSFASQKLIPVAGDISQENLGIEDLSCRNALWEEVDFVLNFAATTNFDERYDVALGTNTLGALNVLNFAKKCHKVQMLVHVSTAYVCGEDRGIIEEKPFQMGQAKKGTSKIDIDLEKNLLQEKLDELQSQNLSDKDIGAALKDFGLQRARNYGWPNTYVFTKAMGEMLLIHLKDKFPLVINRPTMIASTIKEPFPGWIEGIKTIDGILVGYGKGKLTCFLANPQATIDVIPADMVVNCIILAMAARRRNQGSEIIYQIGSSLRNPIKFSSMHEYSYRYFSENPWLDQNGNPLKISKGILFSSMTAFRFYIAIRYQLPLKAFRVAVTLILKRYEEMCTTLDQKLKLVMRLLELFKPYVFFEGIFDDAHSEKLRKAARETCPNDEVEVFDCDPTQINWEHYMTSIHIPGLVKFVVK